MPTSPDGPHVPFGQLRADYQEPWLLAVGRGFPQLLRQPGIGRVACHPEVRRPARPQFDDEEQEDRAKEQIKRLKEIARPHVVSVVLDEGRQVCPDERGGRFFRAWRMYFATVRLLTQCPSFCSSSRIRLAPHRRFSTAIIWIKAIASSGILGWRVVALDLRRQNRRKPRLCHFTTVAGWTISSASLQPLVSRASSTSSSRSRCVSSGRLICRLTTINCWRSSAFSATSSLLLRVRSRIVPTTCLSLRGLMADLNQVSRRSVIDWIVRRGRWMIWEKTFNGCPLRTAGGRSWAASIPLNQAQISPDGLSRYGVKSQAL